MSILNVRGADGTFTGIPAIKGDKGDPGAKGDPGEKGEKGDPGEGMPPATAENDGSIAQVSGGVWTAVPVVPAGRPEFKIRAIAFSDTEEVDIPEGCILGVY